MRLSQLVPQTAVRSMVSKVVNCVELRPVVCSTVSKKVTASTVHV